MSDLEHHIKALHEIREKKREIQDLESETRLKIIELAGTDKQIALGGVELDVTPRTRFKIVDPELVPAFLKSTLPDQQRIDGYFQETGQVPPGVQIQESCVVKVSKDHPQTESQIQAPSLCAENVDSQTPSNQGGFGANAPIDTSRFPLEKDRNMSHSISFSGRRCHCCEVRTSVLKVTFQPHYARGEIPAWSSLNYYYCSSCFISWVSMGTSGFDYSRVVDEYTGLTSDDLRISVRDEYSDPEVIENLDYELAASDICDRCGDESVVKITGEIQEDPTNDLIEIEESLCRYCAADRVYETDEELALYFARLEPELDCERQQSEETQGNYDQHNSDHPDRIKNDPDDPFSDYADGSSPFSY